MKLKYPIIVGASGDLILFESVHDLLAKLDPKDIIAGKYTAYDGEGHLLCLLTTKKDGEPGYGVKGEDAIRVQLVESVQPDEPAVCKLFLDYFDKEELGGVINRQASLEDLFKLYVISYGYNR